MSPNEVLVVTTPWCHNCRAMEPVIDRLAEAHRSSVRVERIDATEQPERVAALGVRATPTVIMTVDGEERARLIGRVSDHDLEQFFVTAGRHRPVPVDGLIRSVAGVALVAIASWAGSIVLAVAGAALLVWAAATMWRWAR